MGPLNSFAYFPIAVLINIRYCQLPVFYWSQLERKISFPRSLDVIPCYVHIIEGMKRLQTNSCMFPYCIPMNLSNSNVWMHDFEWLVVPSIAYEDKGTAVIEGRCGMAFLKHVRSVQIRLSILTASQSANWYNSNSIYHVQHLTLLVVYYHRGWFILISCEYDVYCM